MQPTEQLRPVTNHPLSRDVLPSQVLRDSGSNIPWAFQNQENGGKRTILLFARETHPAKEL